MVFSAGPRGYCRSSGKVTTIGGNGPNGTDRRMKNPRSILITGASSGIGAALACAYAGPGVLLALAGRNAERLEAAATACRRSGAEVRTMLVDVSEETTLGSWIAGLDAERPLDLVIANAGMTGGLAKDGSGESL